ncbi:hypothetical protein Tco_0128598 [Tanacetum coccineum]
MSSSPYFWLWAGCNSKKRRLKEQMSAMEKKTRALVGNVEALNNLLNQRKTIKGIIEACYSNAQQRRQTVAETAKECGWQWRRRPAAVAVGETASKMANKSTRYSEGKSDWQ